MQKLKVLSVNSVLGLKIGGGNAERTFQLSRQLAKKGIISTVLTLNLDLNINRILNLFPAKCVFLPCLCARFYIPNFRWSVINNLVRQSDVVQLFGHWSVLNAIVYLSIRKFKKPYVVIPGGALRKFGRSKLLKSIYNIIIGKKILKNASLCISTTGPELEHFIEYLVEKSRIVTIPNAVEQSELCLSNPDFFSKYNLPEKPYILFVGRINIIKGPDILLESFILVCDQFPQYNLIYAGTDEGLLDKIQSRVIEKGLEKRVFFIGFIDGLDKLAAYQIAKLVVVPSRQEAMSIVAIEAGYSGTAVLVTDQCGLSEITGIDPMLEARCNAIDMAENIKYLLANEGRLSAIASKWKSYVDDRFSWDVVVKKYMKCYRVALGDIRF